MSVESGFTPEKTKPELQVSLDYGVQMKLRENFQIQRKGIIERVIVRK